MHTHRGRKLPSSWQPAVSNNDRRKFGCVPSSENESALAAWRKDNRVDDKRDSFQHDRQQHMLQLQLQLSRALEALQQLQLAPNYATLGPKLSRDTGPGYLFVCNNMTERDCIQYMILASGGNELGTMQRCITIGTPLLLFNFERRHLIGTFIAAQPPATNIVPHAFQGRFTAQVRVVLSPKFRQASLLHQRITGGPKDATEMMEFHRRLWNDAEEQM